MPLLLTVAWLAAGCDDEPSAQRQGSGGAQAQVPTPAVLVATARRQPVTQSTDFVGRVEALEKVDVRARVTGFLLNRHFQEGQAVAEGDLLFTIELDPFAAEVAARKAAIENAQAALTFATFQVNRGRELLRTNAIPQATVDQRVAEQGMAAATLSAARADLQKAEVNLGYTEIRSAIPGRVGRASVTRGNVVGPDSGVLTVVVREDPIKVVFPVTQRQLLILRRKAQELGQDVALRVRVRLPDGSLYDHPGQINFIDVQTDRSTDTAVVQAQFPNPQGLLSDGQFLPVTVEGEEPVQAIVIPQSAVQMDQAGPFVLVVGEGNKVEQRRIRMGRGPAGQTVVEGGLEPGMLVVVEGAQRARPGSVVAPRPAPELPTPGAPAG